jgi:hypothetical protein
MRTIETMHSIADYIQSIKGGQFSDIMHLLVSNESTRFKINYKDFCYTLIHTACIDTPPVNAIHIDDYYININ